MAGERTSDSRISGSKRRLSAPHWPVLLLLLIVLIVCLVWSRALAQADEVAPGLDVADIEEIVVTGSRIPQVMPHPVRTQRVGATGPMIIFYFK